MSLLKLIISKLKSTEFNNIKALLLSYVLKYAIGLIINIWIVRSLGEENFGIFSYVTSVSAIFSIISTFGLQTVVVTSILSSRNNEEGILISNAFIISVLTGIVAAIVQLIFILYFNISERTVILLCLIYLIIYFFDTFKILTYYYEAKVESSKVAKINNISFVFCTGIRLIILYKGLNLYYLAFSYVLDYIITAFLLYYTFPNNLFSFKIIKYEKKIFYNILKQSLPFLFSGLFVSFFMKIDIIMIKNLMNNKQAGIFASSVRLTEIWYFIPGIIQSTFYPSLFNSKENIIVYNNKMVKLYKLMIYFSLIVILTTIIFGKFLILKLFGSSYLEAFEPLKIHIWSLLFVSLSIIRNSKLFALGLSKIYFQITLIGAILNLFLCFILIRQFGVIGASIATMLTYFIISYVLNIFYNELRGEIANINTAFLCLFKKLDN